MMDASQVVTTVEKNYILKLLKNDRRIDGRGLFDFRDIKVESAFVPKAEGSADVYLGNTRVMCGIKYDIGPPFEDSPDEGVATCMSEFVPFASPMFEGGPPSIESIEVARVVDRGIRHGNCIDYKKLCIEYGKQCYILFIDLYIMNYAGNLIDCSSIAAISALLSTKLPTAKMNSEGTSAEWAGDYMPVPIKEIPLQATFAKIGDKVILDPSLSEELVMDGRITMAVNNSGKICSIQKMGLALWTQEEILKYSKLAIEKTNDLRVKLNLRQHEAQM